MNHVYKLSFAQFLVGGLYNNYKHNMIANLIGGFISILIGVSLIGPIATQTASIARTTNSTGGVCVSGSTAATDAGCQLYSAASWGAAVVNMVPGFFALGILGIGIAVTYSSLRQAGIV